MGKVKYKKISDEIEQITAPVHKEQKTRKSIYSASAEVSEHYLLNIKDLIPFKLQARSVFSDKSIEELSESINQHGIRQPLTVVPSPTCPDKYEVVSGERRLRAAEKIGLTKLPCIIIKNYSDAEEIALIENIQREDLHPIEIGESLKKILENSTSLTNVELAKRIGVSKQYISDCLSYCKLPRDVRLKLIQEGIKSRDVLRGILKQENKKEFLDKVTSTTNKTSQRSLFRITQAQGAVNFQYNGLKKLSKEELRDLKDQIDKVFYDLIDVRTH